MLFDADKADRRFAPGGIFFKLTFSAEVKDRVNVRYLNRASRNEEHFVAPEGVGSGGVNAKNGSSAGGIYRAMHEHALRLARQAKIDGKAIDDALAHDAAAQHYFTDSFAAGHCALIVSILKRTGTLNIHVL